MKRTPVVALAGSVAVLLCGCLGLGPSSQGTPSPRPSGSLDIQLIGAGGPYTPGPPDLVAARSEPELDALLQPVAASFHRPDPWDGSANVGGHVFLGITVPFCATLKSVSAHLAGPALVVVQVNAAGLCPPGAGAAARPPMYLASIPDRELPQALVTFRLSSGAGQARVDLRAGHPSMSTADVAVQSRNAVKAAMLKVGADGSSRAVAELDVVQFPSSASPCDALLSTAAQTAGFLVVVNEGPVFPSHEEAFAWVSGALTDCGAAA